MRTSTPRHASPALAAGRPRPRRRAAAPPAAALVAPPSVTGDALLCTKFAAHAGAVNAVAVVKEDDDLIHVATASVDKTCSVFAVSTACPCASGDDPCAEPLPPARLETEAHPRGPVFALAVDAAGADAAATLGDGAPPAGGLPHVFWGGGGESVIRALAPPAGPLPYTLDAGATGWVRCLVAARRTLYSAVCGTVTAWDLSRAVPRPVGAASLFKSDITALAVAPDSSFLFAGAADGSVTAWRLDAAGAPDPASAVAVPAAHAGRVVAAAVHPFSGVLLTASTDGALAAWDGAGLGAGDDRATTPARRVEGAHGGAALRAVAVGADGRVYTGGDDGAVGRWRGGDLAAVEGGPLRGHAAPVRALAAGGRGALVSGDGAGGVCVWRL